MAKPPFRQPDSEKVQFRVNSLIRVPQVRLVGDNMDELSNAAGKPIETGQVYPTRALLNLAEQLELDLVEISPNADPPVVKIIDFNKFLYEKRKREKELKSKTTKTVVKEVRFGPNTDDHDFSFKVRHAQEFLEEGSKVKAFVMFRGRSIVFKDRGELLLLRFLKELDEYGVPELMPKMEGRRMSVILSPRKKK